jgi:hypothetical protein
MKKQVVPNQGGRRKNKTFVPKYSSGSRKITRTKQSKGG